MKRIVLPLCLALTSCGKKPAGQAVYGPHCGICHHGGGGMPGETPPLVGRVDVIAQTPEGRHYLASVLLNGLRGSFTTQGYGYNYSMPAYRDLLTDQQISDTLNWLIARGQIKPAPVITPAEIARARTTPGDPATSYQERKLLEQKHPLP
ncbi:c-type cytochrome [Gluconobacter thailandicus]|uniref:C-type cytochrome n=1 Tax=Gluconobacter thailandicus TaxID=257438 RepID=A0AAP9EPL4_GLUTH|nr:c-type cytochrome [Gluconobacter thailandicus]KXV34002.1 cytochrome c class I [Gluconobacter thailandicus]QEH94975.1 c-type cytochrome [Gluconobacter thailandicus]